jgi:hypothetical protein
MAINLQIQSLTMPDGTEFPGTPQLLSNLQAAYFAITGLESFNGINSGSTTPGSGSRDMPWYRSDNTGAIIGWYAWNGADWVLMPNVVPLLSQVEIDAISAPIGGQAVWNNGSSQLQVYTEAGWEPAMPIQSRFHYDKHVLYPQHQLLASVTNEVTGWTAIDLTSYIAAAGLDAENSDGDKKFTVLAAMVRIEIAQGRTGFVNATYDASIRVGSDDGASTTAQDVLQARAFIAADDSATAGASSNFGFVPPKVGTSSIYYTVIKDSSAVSNLVAKAWLTGLLYTTTDAYFS